jgi:hypothetical protein
MNNFYGVDKIGQNFLINQLESNIKSFLEWNFLNTGGFVNVYRSSSNVHSAPLFKLYTVDEPNFNTGQIWRPARKDWVYESGVDVDGVSPIAISGIYIDNTFYDPSTSGQYQYKIDYKNSRIIFTNRQSTSLNVSMNYSYKWVQTYNYGDAGWWQEIQYNTNNNVAHQTQRNNGDFTLPFTHRVQFPAIVIETVARGTSDPFRLGDKSMRVHQDFLFHVIADNYVDRNNLIDILRLQEDKVLLLYDLNKIVDNNGYPFNFDGTLNTDRIQYDTLISNSSYVWNTCRLENMVVSEVESINADLFEANIRTTAEIIIV